MFFSKIYRICFIVLICSIILLLIQLYKINKHINVKKNNYNIINKETFELDDTDTVDIIFEEIDNSSRFNHHVIESNLQ